MKSVVEMKIAHSHQINLQNYSPLLTQSLIDNNLLENRFRPVALGRKNWLFAGNISRLNAAGSFTLFSNPAPFIKSNPMLILAMCSSGCPICYMPRKIKLMSYCPAIGNHFPTKIPGSLCSGLHKRRLDNKLSYSSYTYFVGRIP